MLNETGERIATALEDIARGGNSTVIDLVYQEKVLNATTKAQVDKLFKTWWTLVYTEGADKTALLNRWFGNVLVDDRVHGAKIPLFATSTSSDGVLTGDSEELTCTPSTASTAGQDDFAALPQFWVLEASQEKNADGSITTYYIQHIDPIEQVRSGEHLCQVLQKNTYYREWDEDGYRMHRQQCMMFEGAERHAPTNAQGKTFEFVANPKYSAGKINGVMTCGTGLAPILWISQQNIISQWHARSPVYCGANYSTLKFLNKMMALKYARKGNSGVIEGCFSYNYQYRASVSETGVKRIIITKAQAANFYVGSNVELGNNENNTDRNTAASYSIARLAKITAIEDITIDDTEYAAVYVDIETSFDTTAGVTLVSSMPYSSGWNDAVLGNDGSRTNYTNGKEPGLLQGIEFALGAYLITGDELMNWVDNRYLEIYTCDDPANAGSALTEHYTKVSTLDCGELSGWQFIQDNIIGDTNFPLAVAGGASSSNGVRAALYVGRSSGLRACWRVAYLLYAGYGGLSALASDSSVGTARWYGSSGAPSVTR